MSERPARHGRATGAARYQWLWLAMRLAMRLTMRLALLLPLLLLLPAVARAQVSRVVVIKVDGLPNDMVDEFARERKRLRHVGRFHESEAQHDVGKAL